VPACTNISERLQLELKRLLPTRAEDAAKVLVEASVNITRRCLELILKVRVLRPLLSVGCQITVDLSQHKLKVLKVLVVRL
jgi:hypothetical protein